MDRQWNVVICFQISIFEPLETAILRRQTGINRLWFAFKLVSLNHWKQLGKYDRSISCVVICFQISIFEPLETAILFKIILFVVLWFAFKLVSLNHWKQQEFFLPLGSSVVICFQISIFEPLETAIAFDYSAKVGLWFAFKLVSLNHWKQRTVHRKPYHIVVICFQISIFEPLETASHLRNNFPIRLWFAFKLVSLNHWKQREKPFWHTGRCCDLLSN